VESGLLLDVVVAQSSAVFKLFTGEDESLLIGWNTFLVLDLGFDILDGVGWFDVQSDSLAGQGLNEDLHTSSQSENQVKGRFFLNIVV